LRFSKDCPLSICCIAGGKAEVADGADVGIVLGNVDKAEALIDDGVTVKDPGRLTADCGMLGTTE